MANNLKIDIIGVNKYQRDCRVWINLLDRKDGSYIVRYKVYETCNNLEINIKYQGSHIAASPYKINGNNLSH